MFRKLFAFLSIVFLFDVCDAKNFSDKVTDRVKDTIKKRFAHILDEKSKGNLAEEFGNVTGEANNIKAFGKDFANIVKADLGNFNQVFKSALSVAESAEKIFQSVGNEKDFFSGFLGGAFFELMSLSNQLSEMVDQKVDFRNSINGVAKFVSLLKGVVEKFSALERNIFNRNKNTKTLKSSFFNKNFFKDLKPIIKDLSGIERDLKALSQKSPTSVGAVGTEAVSLIIEKRDKVFKDPEKFFGDLIMKHVCRIRFLGSEFIRGAEFLKPRSDDLSKYAGKVGGCIENNVTYELMRHKIRTAFNAYFDKKKFVPIVIDVAKSCFSYPRISLSYLFRDLAGLLGYLAEGLNEGSTMLFRLRKEGIDSVQKDIPVKMGSISKKLNALKGHLNKVADGLK